MYYDQRKDPLDITCIISFSTGSEDVKMNMARNLAEMELTDHNKESLFEGGALHPLLELVSHDDMDMKKVAIRALENLSSLPKNGLQMIREGAEQPLLDILFHSSSSYSSLCEHAAATIMHLAASTVSQDSDQTPVSFLESDEDISKLFSLVSLTGPSVQKSIIQTFYILCQSCSTTDIKAKLIQVYISKKPWLKCYAFKYFHHLLSAYRMVWPDMSLNFSMLHQIFFIIKIT